MGRLAVKTAANRRARPKLLGTRAHSHGTRVHVTLVVKKFGGTSVADLDRIRNVAGRVKREVDARASRSPSSSPRWPAPPTSSSTGSTSWSAAYDAREYDLVVATGEQVTIGLLAIALQELGVNARSWLGWQIPIRTDEAHGKARIDDIDRASSVRRCLERGQVAVVAGSRASAPTAASPRSAAAARTPRRWRWRRR